MRLFFIHDQYKMAMSVEEKRWSLDKVKTTNHLLVGKNNFSNWK